MTTPTTKYRRARVAVGSSENTSYPQKPKTTETSSDVTTPPRMVAPPKVEVPPLKPGPVARWVTSKYRDVGRLLSPVDPICGQAFTLAADNAGMAWERAYKSSDFIKRLVDRLMESTIVADLFFANLPIVMAVMAHHNEGFRNYMNDSFLNFLVPADLKEEEKKKETAA